MHLSGLAHLATSLINQHNLGTQGWTFALSRGRRQAASCHYARKQITISVHAVDHDEAILKQLLLHEIAHALVGPRDPWGRTIGHGFRWRQKAREIGYTGGRLVTLPELPAEEPTK